MSPPVKNFPAVGADRHILLHIFPIRNGTQNVASKLKNAAYFRETSAALCVIQVFQNF